MPHPSLLSCALIASLATATATAQSPITSSIYRFQDGDTGTGLGYTAAILGDANGDGFDDIVAGIAFDDTNGQNTGGARVYSGLDGSEIRTHHGTVAQDYMGRVVSGAGDMNGDGYDDYAVSAFAATVNATRDGYVTVFSGVDGTPLHTWTGSYTEYRLGIWVAPAGDVNGDGFADLAVGARAGSTDRGRALVFSGADGSTLLDVLGNYGTELGTGIDGAGDVNGDGYDDIVAGAPEVDIIGGDTSVGQVRVFSGADGSELHTITGDSYADRLGYSVAGVGDVDGDGFADFAAGAPGDGAAPPIRTGAVHVYSGYSGALLYTVWGNSQSDAFGDKIDGAGDLNGDGYDDFVVGAYYDDAFGVVAGSMTLVSGVDGSVLHLYGFAGTRELGTCVSGGGDVNGDGYDDVLAGGTFYDTGVNVWNYRPAPTPSIEQIHGTACVGGFGALPRIDYAGHARIGTVFVVELRGAAPNSATTALSFGTALPPTPLDAIGLPGCSLYVNPYANITAGTDAFGMSALTIPIPFDGGMIGTPFEFQWVVSDPNAPYALPLTFSDALSVRVGG